MTDIAYTTLDGTAARLAAPDAAALAAGIRGGVLTPLDNEYDDARKILERHVESAPGNDRALHRRAGRAPRRQLCARA